MAFARLEMTPVQMTADKRLMERQAGEAPAPVKSFGEFLIDELKETNRLQLEAAEMKKKLAAGEVDDVADVMIAGQKADFALNMTMQVRNRFVEAFQELSRMQI